MPPPTDNSLSAVRPWRVMSFGSQPADGHDQWRVMAAAVREAFECGEEPIIVFSALPGMRESISEALDEIAAGKWHQEPDKATALTATIFEQHLAAVAEHDVVHEVQGRLERIIADLERALYGSALLGEVTPSLRARAHAAMDLAASQTAATVLHRLCEGRYGAIRWHDPRELLQADDAGRSGEGRNLNAGTAKRPPPSLEERLGKEDGPLIHVVPDTIADIAYDEASRPGSRGADVSAALLAERLSVKWLEVWSELPGLFTADPRLVPSARLLRHIGYAEAQELASTGAPGVHPRTVEIARRAGLELRMRCAHRPEAQGTVISSQAPDAGAGVLALAVKRDMSLLTMETPGMWQQVGFLADVFGVFKAHGLSIDLVSTSETSVSVTLDPVANALDQTVIGAVMEALRAHCEPRLAEPLGTISLVGRGLRAVLPELAPAFEVLDGQAVHLISQAASDLNLSVVVDADQVERIVRELHAGFFGAVSEGPVFGPTYGRAMVGQDVEAPAEVWWRSRRKELITLAEEGTPRYVYHLDTVREAARCLLDLEPVDRVLFAMKANSHPEILRALAAEGLGFDCVSLDEVTHLLRHVPHLAPERILFTPNFAPRDEYERALEAGVRVTVDNQYVLETWPEIFAGRDIFLRVDPGRGRGHHVGVRTAGRGSKFGIAPQALPRTATLVGAANARVVGLHAHLGSGITDPLAWAETAAVLAGFMAPFPDIRALDLGGGLGVPSAAGGAAFNVQQAAEHLAAFKQHRPNLELWLEPGRFLVAESGVLLARVTQRKKKGNVVFVGVDAGMHTLIRPALYGSYHEIVNLSRLDEISTEVVEVVGPICESGDVLGHGRRLPQSAEGDVLLIGNAGAYGRVMASTYNQRPIPEESVLT